MARKRGAVPFVPAGRGETQRRELVELLREEEPQSARELSQRAGIAEADVVAHLEHIRLALPLAVSPARCIACGFHFSKRERLKAPGRCPACRSERISEPRYAIR